MSLQTDHPNIYWSRKWTYKQISSILLVNDQSYKIWLDALCQSILRLVNQKINGYGPHVHLTELLDHKFQALSGFVDLGSLRTQSWTRSTEPVQHWGECVSGWTYKQIGSISLSRRWTYKQISSILLVRSWT
jgi:hypothetical protein